MADPSAERGAETILSLRKPSSSLSKDELWETSVACEAAKAAMLMSVRELLRNADDLPVLTSKS